ncbi:MAG TPA: hypothetical protein VKX16_10390 [Chloroflexota bacterium]|nr:hypothetical protein [Chloroflexota bacterium]
MSSNTEGPQADTAPTPPPWWSTTHQAGTASPTHGHKKSTKKGSHKGKTQQHKGHKGHSSSSKTHVHRKAIGYGVDADHSAGSNYSVLKNFLAANGHPVPHGTYGHHRKSSHGHGHGRHKGSHKLRLPHYRKGRLAKVEKALGIKTPKKHSTSHKSKGVSGHHSSGLVHEKSGGSFLPPHVQLVTAPGIRMPDKGSHLQSFTIRHTNDSALKHPPHSADSRRP